MNARLFAIFFTLMPTLLFSQTKQGGNRNDSTYILMFNVSSVFYTPKDLNINKFMNKYGYQQPLEIPVGITRFLNWRGCQQVGK